MCETSWAKDNGRGKKIHMSHDTNCGYFSKRKKLTSIYLNQLTVKKVLVIKVSLLIWGSLMCYMKNVVKR